MKSRNILLAALCLSAVLSGPSVAAESPTTVNAPDQANMEKAKVVYFPYQEAIIAARTDGLVLENTLRQGQQIKRGDVLVQLDDVKFRVEVQRVEALEKESAALNKFAIENLKIQDELVKQDLSNETDYKRAQLEVETSTARLQAIRANLEEAKNQLSYCVIKAPFDGRIKDIAVRPHEMLKAGQPLLYIINDNYLKATMFVPVALLEKLKLNTEVELYCTDTKTNVTGKVYEIASQADHRSGTIEIHVLIDNAKAKITAGMTGEYYYVKPR